MNSLPRIHNKAGRICVSLFFFSNLEIYLICVSPPLLTCVCDLFLLLSPHLVLVLPFHSLFFFSLSFYTVLCVCVCHGIVKEASFPQRASAVLCWIQLCLLKQLYIYKVFGSVRLSVCLCLYICLYVCLSVYCYMCMYT